ncbi:hypothetical protein BJX66DRAFT_315853 [Aspergillus keveii]|uniref:Uncharacterized protein n=1 Tax=Aspergillus keveii TaxID=714993 RepID=A0ABR4FNV5_9EURO
MISLRLIHLTSCLLPLLAALTTAIPSLTIQTSDVNIKNLDYCSTYTDCDRCTLQWRCCRRGTETCSCFDPRRGQTEWDLLCR